MFFDKDIAYLLKKPDFTGFSRMLAVKQHFDDHFVENIEETVCQEIEKISLDGLMGKKIAVTAGSRGIPNCVQILRAIGKTLRARGAAPFVVPAMGSHGNGTAEGQVELLASYGITEDSLEMPIRSSMDTVFLGVSASGAKVYCDRNACEADGIVVCGRVKPHTDFRGTIESGLCKMMVVGLGKHQGAVAFHKSGSGPMAERLRTAAALFLEKTKVLCGIAIIDNAFHNTKIIEAVRPSDILKREPELLIAAAGAMPKLLFDEIEALIVDEYGKEISGAGMDPNVTGRFLFAPYEHFSGYPRVKKIAILRLTEASHGNAAGLGIADYVSRRFANAIDLASTYTNSLTSTLSMGKIPMVMNDDLDTLYATVSACGKPDVKDVRTIVIKNTLELDNVLVSENYLPEIAGRTDVTITGEPRELVFGPDNALHLPWESA